MRDIGDIFRILSAIIITIAPSITFTSIAKFKTGQVVNLKGAPTFGVPSPTEFSMQFMGHKFEQELF